MSQTTISNDDKKAEILGRHQTIGLSGHNPLEFWQEVNQKTNAAVKEIITFSQQQAANIIVSTFTTLVGTISNQGDELALLRALETHVHNETLTPEILSSTLEQLTQLRLQQSGVK